MATVPNIAFIVPAYRAADLHKTLQSLAMQTDRDFSVYLADDAVPEDLSAIDVGKGTIENYCSLIASAKTVLVNGPMGVFEQEPSELGTKSIFEALGSTSAYTVVGGGDSVTAAKKYKVTDKLGYVCTGGGALIRFLTGEELPVVKALRHAAAVFGKGEA